MILPVAISRAANSAVVPCLTYSWVALLLQSQHQPRHDHDGGTRRMARRRAHRPATEQSHRGQRGNPGRHRIPRMIRPLAARARPALRPRPVPSQPTRNPNPGHTTRRTTAAARHHLKQLDRGIWRGSGGRPPGSPRRRRCRSRGPPCLGGGDDQVGRGAVENVAHTTDRHLDQHRVNTNRKANASAGKPTTPPVVDRSLGAARSPLTSTTPPPRTPGHNR